MIMRFLTTVAVLLVVSVNLLASVSISGNARKVISNGYAEESMNAEAQVVIAIASYACGIGESVDYTEFDSDPMTVTSNMGCLYSMEMSELWWGVCGNGSGLGVVDLVGTSDGEMVFLVLDSADTSTPMEEVGISIGKDVSAAVVDKVSGDGTIIVVFSDSGNETLTTPSGFELVFSTDLSTDVRASCFIDADASQATATLTFSGSVKYIAYIIGVNNV